MFEELILKSAACGDNKRNIITDGTYQCTYHELIEIFAALDQFFGKSAVSPGDCSVLICGNSLPEAVLLLWLLYRKRHFLLLPRGGLVFSLPEFCQHKILVDLNSPGLDIKVPDTNLAIEPNPGFSADASLPGAGGSIFLKTSGSTAEPKLVMHSHEGFVQNAVNCIKRFEITPNDRLLIPVPIYHMYALGAAIIPGIIAGASINLLEKTNIITYLDREKQYQPNVSFLTPPLCHMFLRTRKSPYRYRLVVTAGDRITPAVFENFETKFGKLVNLYGSTELGAIATNKLADPLNIRSNGILETMPGVTMDFTDKESENDPEKVSEIICSHDYGFDAYVDKKGRKITAETAKPFRTKDLGKRISTNRFQVVGRTGNSVNRHGILVAFSEVESIIEQGIEEVAHAVVTGGKEDITRGKKMIAWCELKPGTKLNDRDLRSRCFDMMLRHMVPDEVRVIKEIPRLPNGKFDRKKLAALQGAQ
ncbi:MAG: acyl--CoA ligase [Candidatus Aminicenantes bacterium]|nr:MAG: acyl--CoA ligase [Candidatus Aminicenantes bacterium]